MKQVIQSRRSGKLALKNIPEPKVRRGCLLVRTRTSLISAGTERMVIDFAKKSLAGKAKARPDLVKKVIGKARRDGLVATFKTVMARLDEPLPLGYSACGIVEAVGAGLEGVYRVGERVAMAGAGLANHAELNVVPENLVAPVPEDVSDREACFGTLGAIALHAVRNLEPKLGDVVAVIGAGLVGQLAAQFLKLSGARVVIVDYDPARLEQANALGAEATFNLGNGDPSDDIRALTSGRGCDSVLIAAATASSAPFELAAEVARDRARVTMVGLTGTEFPYGEFMKKELNIIISRSYGPGRYDDDFEEKGVKYPVGWVRWTETDNLAETVRLMSGNLNHRLDVQALISHHFDLDTIENAYGLITDGKVPHMGVVIDYPEVSASSTAAVTKLSTPSALAASNKCVLGVIGAGNFAKTVLLPELKSNNNVHLHTLVTQKGATSDHGQQTFSFAHASADEADVIDNPEINAVLIATRHDSHAELAARALKAGKAVLVEKPLALDMAGLNQVIEAYNSPEASSAFFQIGFNRRFAPMSNQVRAGLAAAKGAKVVLIRINAGHIPAEHWVHDAEIGGGRILGELCHFVDLARYLIGCPIQSVQAHAATLSEGGCDDVSVSLQFSDGSLATLLYTGLGDGSSGKERVEAYAGGNNYLIEDFRKYSESGSGGSNSNTATQDKGFKQSLSAFVTAVTSGGNVPIDETELIETSLATLCILESLRSGTTITLKEY